MHFLNLNFYSDSSTGGSSRQWDGLLTRGSEGVKSTAADHTHLQVRARVYCAVEPRSTK